MDQQQITEKLRTIIKPYVQDEEAFSNIKPDTDLLRDLKINSAHLVDIILDTEDAFDIEISDEDAEQMLTVQDAVAVIMRRVGE
jgi:acyl carrier protein